VALVIPATGVLGNDSDVENDLLSAVLVTGPAHGSLILNGNGSFTYTPDANYDGPDSFSYKANDGDLDSNIAVVELTVNPANDAPVAQPDSASGDEDTPIRGQVVATDVDNSADQLWSPARATAAWRSTLTARSPTRRMPISTARIASATRPTTAASTAT
jgi:large repetitive protein